MERRLIVDNFVDNFADVWDQRALNYLCGLALGRTLAEGVPFVLGRLENDDAAEALLACGPNHSARALVVERVRLACLSLFDACLIMYDRLKIEHANDKSLNVWRPVRIGREPYDGSQPLPGEIDGTTVLLWDAMFIAWARERFPGQSRVADFTNGAAARWETWATGQGEQLDLAPGGRLLALWKPWCANATPFQSCQIEPDRFTRIAAWITGAVWDELRAEIGASLDREAALVAPGLTLPFANTRAQLAERAMLSKNGEVLSGHHSTGLAVAPGFDLSTWTAVARTLHTLSARRAVAWLARVAWLAHCAGDRGASGAGWSASVQHDRSVVVTVEGGLTGLASVLEINGKDAGGEVFAALEALAGVVLSVRTHPEAGLTGALIAQVRRTRGGPGRPGVVSCTLSPWWLPGAVHGLVENADRVIVPVLSPPPVDVLAAPMRTFGAALEERALIQLATHAREVVSLGGVVIDWHELAPELKATDVDALVDDWRKDGRWVRVSHDRWMLGTSDPDLAAAGGLIRQGGAMREARARGGRKSAARKRGERS